MFFFQVSGDTTAEAPGQARRLVNMIRSFGEEYVHMSFLGFLKQIHFSVPTISEKLARMILDDINADDLRRIPGWQQRWKLITIQLGGNDICRCLCRFHLPRHTSLLLPICVYYLFLSQRLL